MSQEPRQLVAERGLTAAAVQALTPLMDAVSFESLAIVKDLLKRFFSAGPWTAVDAVALSGAIGAPPGDAKPEAGERMLRRRLDADLTLVAGWVDAAFFVDVLAEADRPDSDDQWAATDLGSTFDYDVIPEPTPNPRTLRFATPPRADAPSQSYTRGSAARDERVQAIFDSDERVIDVLVASDFVAVSVARASNWPAMLEPVLRAVASGFGGAAADGGTAEREPAPGQGVTLDVRAHSNREAARRPRKPTRLDRAWEDLGGLDLTQPEGIAALAAAARDGDVAQRQVAARLLVDAPSDVALEAWSLVLADASRVVRRAALDAVVDAEREELRPLLERALHDADGWIRWKALHGLVTLGAAPSLEVIDALAADPDFRVRLEATNAARRARGDA